MKKLYSILFLMLLALSSIANAQETAGVKTEYPGYLNVTILDTETGESMPVAENESNTITITEYADGTCDFLLPNFALSAMQLELGNILVEGATVTKDEAGVATYNGFVKDMPLLDGALIADVTLGGTITADGVVNMLIDVLWDGVPIKCTFTTKEVKAGVATDYPGYLNVTMMDEAVVVNQANTINIVENGNGTCVFTLPDFRLEEGGDSMGDITVENVTMTTAADGVTTYEGIKNGLELLGGELVVDVTLNGTITAEGVVDMKIDVLWMGIPIECTFTSDAAIGVEGIVVDENVTPVYYNLQGVKVANPENGVFIKVQGSKATKVIM